jgi:hypothetical protein
MISQPAHRPVGPVPGDPADAGVPRAKGEERIPDREQAGGIAPLPADTKFVAHERGTEPR